MYVLLKKGREKRTEKYSGSGIPEVQSGLPVYISIPEAGIKKTYWVDTDRHEFKGTKHTMTIDVVEKNTMPEGVS